MSEPEIPIQSFETYADGLDHPECLAFDSDGWLWAGGEAGQVYRIDPSGRVEKIDDLGSFNSGLAFSPKGELIVCNARLGLVHVRRSGDHAVFADHAEGYRLIEPNFPVFDSSANMYVSDSGGWKKNRGYILRFDCNGCGRVVGGPYGYANGLALTADERYLFMAESDTHRVLRFELLKDGALGPTETYADQIGRVPDGLALDEEGNLFVSCYASDDIYRVSSSGRVELFAADPDGIILSRPTNMAFGVQDRAELYVANLGGHVITRVQTSHCGQPLANQKRYEQTSK